MSIQCIIFVNSNFRSSLTKSFHNLLFSNVNLIRNFLLHFQTLAIYDRFGRLMYGSESVAKDVLEYVVFEKHIASQYGEWRIHHKILPDWTPNNELSSRTYLETEEEAISQTEAGSEEAKAVIEVPA